MYCVYIDQFSHSGSHDHFIAFDEQNDIVRKLMCATVANDTQHTDHKYLY